MGLEFQNCIDPQCPLMVARVLLEWIERIGQRSVLANFRTDRQRAGWLSEPGDR